MHHVIRPDCGPPSEVPDVAGVLELSVIHSHMARLVKLSPAAWLHGADDNSVQRGSVPGDDKHLLCVLSHTACKANFM